LLVDGKPIWDLPAVEKAKTPLDLDHEFDGGSQITLTSLNTLQIENLATLGKIWGFLKYYHPVIASGKRHWDYELFRVMGKILAAEDRASAQAELRKWIAGLGTVEECLRCARLDEKDLYLKPDVAWISDQKMLGTELSQELQRIYTNRPISPESFYVSMAPNVGNPSFDHEQAYRAIKLPDAGFQILSLYRFWNIIQYWYPYRDITGEDWNAVLTEFLPRIGLAKTSDSYQLELMALIARVHDTHANLWSSIRVRPPLRDCQVPVVVRFVGDSAVVAGYSRADGGIVPLKTGDVITSIDGKTVSDLIASWVPFYADSNNAARLRDMGRSLTNGACGDATLTIRREEQTMTVSTPRISRELVDATAGGTHDLPGATFRKLSDDIAYLKLSTVKSADAVNYIDYASGTKGLVIDLRNYPSEFMVFSLGQHLVDKPTEFARFTTGDPAYPGAFRWTPPLTLTPQEPRYKGKIVILVDEVSQSQAEYTAMAFRAARGAIVIGSTTAGADGNVSAIPLPGGFQSMISGIGVFYPDKKATQRIGILPDVEVKPTVAGIRTGRDEVLEEALRQILGKDTPQAGIEALARP
jgi:hypothetical protein